MIQAGTASPLLEAQNLRKVFRRAGLRGGEDTVAVDDVSFVLHRGQALAIAGESGSGKSTVARMLVGLERPTSGRIMLNGAGQVPPRGRKHRLAHGRAIQMVFQDPYTSLDPQQRVRNALHEIVSLHATSSKVSVRERVDQLLDDVGLGAATAQRRPRDLSGGQRQRVAIARALAAEPSVLILDEAVAALDVSVQAQVLNLLADLRRVRDIAYLFISHDLAVIQQVCDDVLIIRKGIVIETGSAMTVLQNPAHPYTRALIDAIPRPGWRPTRVTADLEQASRNE